MPWDGTDRREHDMDCAARMDKCISELKAWVREWTSAQICIATKGGKIWRQWMRPIILLLLTAAIGGHFIPGTSNSQEPTIKDQELELRLNSLEESQKKTTDKLGDIDHKLQDVDKKMFIQTYILEQMAKEYNIKVPQNSPR